MATIWNFDPNYSLPNVTQDNLPKKLQIVATWLQFSTEEYMVRASLETVCLFKGDAKVYFFAIEHTYFRLFHYTELLLDQTARQLALPLERQQLWHCKLLVEFDLRQLGPQLF